MGLILDSSVLITAERQGQNVRQMLAAISGPAGNAEIAISVVTLIELAHGAARADAPQPFSDDPRPEDRFPVSNSPFFRYRFHPHEFASATFPAGIIETESSRTLLDITQLL